MPIDGSGSAERALSLAIGLAGTRHGELIIAHDINLVALCAEGIGAFGADPRPVIDILEREEEKLLADALSKARESEVSATTVALDGNPASQILALAQERGVDAIVMGTQGKRGVERFVVGSVAESVLREAPMPVFVVNEECKQIPRGGRFHRIFVAADASGPATAAAHFAVHLAASDRAEIVFCHVAGERDETPLSFEVAQKLAADRGVQSEPLVVHGRHTAEVILASAQATGSDLIAIGTHGRRGFDHIVLGSVAETVVRNSTLPVVVVRKHVLSVAQAHAIARS